MGEQAKVERVAKGTTAEEREYIFGGSCAEEWWTIDIAKCPRFGKHIRRWRRGSVEQPENVKLRYEDEYHVMFKVRWKRVVYPFLKPRKEADEAEEATEAEGGEDIALNGVDEAASFDL